MSAVDQPSPVPPIRHDEVAWIRSLRREIARGRHPILHGAVLDLAPWQGRYLHLSRVLGEILDEAGYQVVGFYNPLDGICFRDRQAGECFHTLAGRAEAIEREPDTNQISAGDSTRVARHRRAMGAATRARRRQTTLRDPNHALPAIRRAVTQNRVPVASVISYADILFQHPNIPDPNDRESLMGVKAISHDAALVHGPSNTSLRNLIVLVAEDLCDIPAILFEHDPLFVPVHLPLPDRPGRQEFFDRYLDAFCGGDALRAEQRTEAVRSLAKLTDGYAYWDLESLRRTSVAEQLSVTDPRPLVLFHDFGERTDPWAELDHASIRNARDGLRHRVIGQDHAVDALVTMLAKAWLGIGAAADPDAPGNRPRGVFFFVGPTGVGKTLLAKRLAEFLFGDESALARFDMAEFSAEHSVARLFGAPPGYVGFSDGGELTNRALERPFTVYLFDEIEKAHPRVLDKFMGILEDGRATDGRGRTVSFGQAVIIFTANIGADGLPALQAAGQPELTYEQVIAHFEIEVRRHFIDVLGRPELLGRLGKGIVPFDVLRDEALDPIIRRGVDDALRGYRRRPHVTIRSIDDVCEHIAKLMRLPENRMLGGRRVVHLVEREVIDPLARWLLDHEITPGLELSLGMIDGELRVTSAPPTIDALLAPTRPSIPGETQSQGGTER